MRALGVVVLLVALLGLATANIHLVSPGDSGFDVSLLKSYYDLNTGRTVFVYRVHISGALDILRWTVRPDCDTQLPIVIGDSEWRVVSYDHLTGALVYLYDDVQTTSEPYREVRLEFNGPVFRSQVQVTARGETVYSEQSTEGPGCLAEAQNPYSEPQLPEASFSLDCTAYPDDIPENAEDTIVPGNCNNTFTVNRVYSFTNQANGYVSHFTQVIHVSDTDGPVFDAVNTTLTLECGRDAVPAVPSVHVTDNCDPSTDDDLLEEDVCIERVTGSCPNTFFETRTWKAVDDCGNSNCLTQTIVVDDTLPPVFSNVPADVTLQCGEEVPTASADSVDVADLCGDCYADDTPVVFHETRIEACGPTYELSRTWTSTDCCGNSAHVKQHVLVIDETAPELTLSGDNTTVFECSDELTYPTIEALDDCDGAIPVGPPNATNSPLSCNDSYSQERHWMVCDECGNVATITQHVTVLDRTPPQFVDGSLPENVTVSCGNVPTAELPAATDNCDDDVLVTYEDTTVPSSCTNEYVIYRTFTATDNCDHSTTYTQTITVVDDTTPDLPQIPADQSVECADQVVYTEQLELPTSQDECEQDHVLTQFNETTPGSCPNQFTVVEYFSVSDCAGNSQTATRTITVSDDEEPVFTPVDDVSAPCYNVPSAAQPAVSDNCDDITPDLESQTIPGACTGRYVINNTWTAVDLCGNAASITQLILVDDVDAPVFLSGPNDTTAECDDIPAASDPVADDQCSTATVVRLPDEIVNGTCRNEYTIIRTWNATDDCDNTAQFVQNVHVQDTTPPELTEITNPSVTAECDPPARPDVQVNDNCAGVSVYLDETIANSTVCIANYVLTRNYTGTDACGNVVFETQVVTVHDTLPPIFDGVPQDSTIDCLNPTFPPAPTASDACSEYTINPHHSTTILNCPQNYDAFRNFAAVDACGNVAWFNYTVHVRDTHDPTLSPVSPVSNYCNEPTPPTVTASDDCDTSVPVSGPTRTDLVRLGNHCYNYSLSWSAQDDCGHTASTSQVVTIYDDRRPVFNRTGQTLSFECVAPPVAVNPAGATDDCEGPLTVSLSTANESYHCEHDYVTVRTFTATDSCGNVATIQDRITVYDNKAPNFTAVPDNVTAQCAINVPPPGQVCVIDNCAGLDVYTNKTTTTGSCPNKYSVVYTWTAVDACGLTSYAAQSITVNDNTAPTFNGPAPTDQTVTCNLPPITPPTLSDNCGAVNPVEDLGTTENGNCAFRKVRHVAFRGTDVCGNVAWYNYTITVTDNVNPTVVWSPAAPTNATINACSFPAPPNPTVSDNCGGGTYTYGEFPLDGTCPLRRGVHRQWNFTDACGNGFTVDQYLYLNYSAAPTITQPQDEVHECDETFDRPTVTASDACGNPLTPTFDEDRSNGSCEAEYNLTRTWTATDSCGLSSTVHQLVQVLDREAPYFNTPSDLQVDYACEDVDYANITASDDCSSFDLSYSRVETARECAYRFTQVLTYTATDACGNVYSDNQTVDYTWEVPPTFDNFPADLYDIQCDNIPDAPNVTAHDGCLNAVPVSFDETTEEGPCPNSYVIVRTWTATDACNISYTDSQRIHVVDTVEPTLTGVPATLHVECGFVPDVANVTAHDTCPGVTLTFEEVEQVLNDNCCLRIITRTWTATDACNNTHTENQIIYVNDTIPPQLEIPPNECHQCPWEPEEPVVVAGNPPLALGFCPEAEIANDNCSAAEPLDATVQVQTAGPLLSLNFVDGSYAIRWNDHVGRAFIYGEVRSADGDRYILDLEFSGLVADPTGYPVVKELKDDCYGTGSTSLADVSNWRVYSSADGNLTGIAGTSTSDFGILRYHAAGPTAAQFGLGANGHNLNYGVTVALANEASEPTLVHADLTPDGSDDCYVDREVYPTKALLNVHVVYPLLPEELDGALFCPSSFTPVDQCSEWFTENQSPQAVIDIPALGALHFTSQAVVAKLSHTLTITGRLEDMSGNQYDIHLTLSDPVSGANYNGVLTLELLNECYAGSGSGHETVNPNTWTVYDDLSGNITGVANTATAGVNLPLTSSADPFASIFGHGASGLNQGTGLTAWVTISGAGSPVALRVDLTPNLQDECRLLTERPCGHLECDDQIFVNITREDISGNCPGNRTIIYHIHAEDETGNFVDGEQVITIKDTIPPHFTEVGSNTVLQCGEPLPAPNATAVDDCDPDVEVTSEVGQPFNISAECPFRYEQDRTYTAVDDCDNYATAVQHFHYNDWTPPTLHGVPLEDDNVNCDDQIETPSVNATDNCDPSPVVSDMNETRVDGDCPYRYILVRSWSATDSCGLSTYATYDVVVDDSDAPVFSNVPASVTINCTDDVPTDAPTCNDVCSGDITPELDETWNNQSCVKQLTRTWTCTDECGNSALPVSQIITIVDNTIPVFDEEPADESVTCGNVPDQITLTASDACDDSAITVTENQPVVSGETCPYNFTLTYSWTAEDCAGNAVTVDQVITSVDDEAPIIHGDFPDVTLDCLDEVPTAGFINATDNCEEVTVTSDDEHISLGCVHHYEVIRTITATDACDHTTTVTQRFLVEDNEAPYFTENRTDRSVYCADFTYDIPPNAEDRCGQATVEDHQTTSSPVCEGSMSLAYAWRAVDECGNEAWLNYTVTTYDDVDPELSNVPGNAEDECEARSVTTPTASDACTTVVDVTADFEDISEGCPYNFTRVWTWTATDDCENSVTASTTIVVRDTQPPTWDGDLPEDISISCDDTIPEAASLTCSDNCGSTTVEPTEDAPTEEGCPNRVIVRTWTCTDECDHSITHTQRITITDTEAPTLEGVPEDASIECDETVPEASVTASDNCDLDVPVQSDEERTSGSCEDAYTINRTWSAQDDCGNSVSDYQLIHVSDTTPPYYDDCDCGSADCAHCDHAFSCDEEQPTPEEPIFSDNCDADVFVELFTVEHSGRCAFERIVDYNWRGEDNCGNFAWHNYSYSTNDTEAPTFPSPPEDLTVECDSIPSVEVPAAEDNCDEVSVSDQQSGEAPSGCQNYEITHVFTATDSCGNSNSVTQVVHVVDTTPPTFDGQLPTDFSAECSELPLEVPTLTASDNCGEATVTAEQTPLDEECPNGYREQWSWTATDACGLSTTYSIIVTVYDNTPPTIEGLTADETRNCDASPCLNDSVTARDNCNGVNLTADIINSGDSCHEVVTYTFLAMDGCGNVATAEKTISLIDTTPPSFDGEFPGDQTIECGPLPEPVTLTASDDCNNVSVTVGTTSHNDGCPANYTTIYTYTAQDICGNSYSQNQTIIVRDTLPPNATVPPPVCLDSFTDFDFFIEHATDNGKLFFGEDACSAVTIVITGCRSNQDAAFGLDLSGPFTDHCYYDAANDTLVVSSKLIPTFEEGRVYRVEGEVIDACGHSVSVYRLLYIALDEDSDEFIHNLDGTPFQLPDDFDTQSCEHFFDLCLHEICPCEDDSRFCVEYDGLDSVQFLPLTNNANPEFSYDEALDQTVFGYKLVHGGNVPHRIVLGFDLSRLTIVSVSPADHVEFGFPADSYVSGISWYLSPSTPDNTIFSVTMKGKVYQSGEPNTPVLLGGGDDGLTIGSVIVAPDNCSPVRLTYGPDYSSIDNSANPNYVSGTVFVSGADSGETRDARIPVPHTLVQLVKKGVPTRQVVLQTLTTADGHFRFHGVTGVNHLAVALARDGFLRPGRDYQIGSAGELIGVETVDISFQFPLGEAVPAFYGAGNDLTQLVLLDGTAARYVRPRSSGNELGFNGDSQSLEYWRYQVRNFGVTETEDRIAQLVADAQALIPACTGIIDPSNVYSVGTPLAQELFTAALNVADGRGIFEPYAPIMQFYIDYAAFVECTETSPSAADINSALAVLYRLNGAGEP